jgi:hypothetical protein
VRLGMLFEGPGLDYHYYYGVKGREGKESNFVLV